MYVGCPNCRGWMVGDGIPVGAAVLCPHCQRQFVMTQAILAAAMQGESPPAPGASGGPPGEAVSPGLAGGPMGGMPQTTPPGRGPGLPPSGSQASPAGPTGPAGTWPSGGWGMPPSGGTTQTPGMGQMGIPGAGMPPSAMPGGMPPGVVGSAMPGSLQGPPAQAMGYPPSAAPAAREPTQPRARRPFLGIEAIVIMGFSLMVAAIIVVVVIGYGDRPAFRHLGQQEKRGSPGTSSGPQMIVSYEPRKGILYIENADRDWKDAELRINPDPADDEGGYRCQLGPMPRGRKKPILLNQCLSPSGARFEGELERIVVIAQTVDGTLRYVSQVASFK